MEVDNGFREAGREGPARTARAVPLRRRRAVWILAAAALGAHLGMAQLETPVATFHGTLKSVNKKELVLETGGEHEVVFAISRKTKFSKKDKPIKPSEIPAGAPLSVDGKRDLAGNTEAVAVRVEQAPPTD